VLRSALSLVSVDPSGSHDYSTRNAGTLASGRLSPLLALEIASPGRATADRGGIARADPANEHGEFALGCAAHPRRTAQAWVCGRAVERRQVHGQTAWAVQPGMADLLG